MTTMGGYEGIQLITFVGFCLMPSVLAIPKNATPSHEHRLMKALFKYYDPSVRPRYNSSYTVDVAVRFSLQQINDLDEKRQILKISGWITAEWMDEFLTWNPADFGGLTSLVVQPRKMWVPKLAIGNSAKKLFDGEHYKRFWITVRSDGSARWQPGGVFAIACALDMNFYPFDDQRCTMEIETWVYTADKVNLSSSMTEVGIDTYIPHGEWDILGTEAKSVNVVYRYYLSEFFPEVYVTIFIRRKYTFYFMYILLPCIMLSGVLLMVFQLPAESGEKVSLGVSILVAISVFLLLVAGNVPDTSDAVPIISIYLTYFMMTTTLAVAMSVLVVKLHFKSPEHKPPRWLRVFLFEFVARVVNMQSHQHYYKTVVMKKKQRDMTWSQTFTEEIRSHNSRGALSVTTPDGGQENYELLHQRRKAPNDAESNDVTEANNATSPSTGLSQRYHASSEPHFGSSYFRSSDGTDINEWRKMAEILDRFLFWAFLVFIIVPTSCIIGFVRLFKPKL